MSRPARWILVLVLGILLALVMVFSVRIPARIDYVWATILSHTPMQTEMGNPPVYTASDLRGRTYPMISHDDTNRALLAPGKTICVKVQTDRFTGRVTTQHAPGHPSCGPPAQWGD